MDLTLILSIDNTRVVLSALPLYLRYLHRRGTHRAATDNGRDVP
jgi:hypothetical protein